MSHLNGKALTTDLCSTTYIMGNLILLGRPPELSSFERSSQGLASMLTRYTLSLSLSRSSALSVLEGRLDRHINSVSGLPAALMRSGAQPMGRKEVIRKLGELMTLRMAVNARGGGLEATPEVSCEFCCVVLLTSTADLLV